MYRLARRGLFIFSALILVLCLSPGGSFCVSATPIQSGASDGLDAGQSQSIKIRHTRDQIKGMLANHRALIGRRPHSVRTGILRRDELSEENMSGNLTKNHPSKTKETTWPRKTPASSQQLHYSPSYPVLEHRGSADPLAELLTYRETILSSTSALAALSSQAPGQSSPSFVQDCTQQITSLHNALQGINSLFSGLAQDRGLANYDKSNQLETALKDIINSVKDFLSALDDGIYEIPGIGPILGPIVYDIKCIIDSILDTVENLTDGLLNGIQPLLQNLSLSAAQGACQSGIKIIGLCF